MVELQSSKLCVWVRFLLFLKNPHIKTPKTEQSQKNENFSNTKISENVIEEKNT